MYLNTSQVREAAATQWLLAFHQLCTAALNLRMEQASSTSLLPSSVALSVSTVFDSMQRKCDNLTGWVLEQTQDTVLASHLRAIMAYNHGGAACKLTDALPFSFTQSPQLFFRGYNETEEEEAARQAAVMAHIYKIQGGLVVCMTILVFIVFALLIYIVMIRNKRREYSCFKATEENIVYSVSGAEDIKIEDSESDSYEQGYTHAPKQKDQ